MGEAAGGWKQMTELLAVSRDKIGQLVKICFPKALPDPGQVAGAKVMMA